MKSCKPFDYKFRTSSDVRYRAYIRQRFKAAEEMLGILRRWFDELADTLREILQMLT